MGNNRMFKLRLSGLDCANCANKIEERVNQLELVEEANLNFSTSQLTVFIKESEFKNEVIDAIKQIVKQLEPHVIVEENQHLIEKERVTVVKVLVHLQPSHLRALMYLKDLI